MYRKLERLRHGTMVRLWPAIPGIALFTFVVGGAFKIFVVNAMDDAVNLDFPWLLEAGRHVIASGGLPATDIFSWTHADQPWVLYQWLFEVLLAGGTGWLGLPVVVHLFLFSVAAIYILIPLFMGVPRKVPVILTGITASLALVILNANMSIRPIIFTSLFLLLQYLVVDALRKRRVRMPTAFVAIALIYVLWSNIHMGVILGFVSLLLMVIGDTIEFAGLRRFDPADPAIEGAPLAPKAYLLLIGIAFAACLVNPYGIEILERIIVLSGQSDHTNTIEELQPLSLRWVPGQLLMILFGGFLVCMLRARRTMSLRDILHIVVFTIMSIAVLRLIIWAALFYVLILPKALYQAIVADRDESSVLRTLVEAPERYRKLLESVLVGLSVFILLILPQIFAPLNMGQCEPLMASLRKAAKMIPPGEKFFNDGMVGSCLLLLEPERKLFIDTRFEFYGGHFTAETARFLAAPQDWRAFVGKWKFDEMLFMRSWPLDRVLAEAPDWKLVYGDNELVLYRRIGQPAAEFGGGPSGLLPRHAGGRGQTPVSDL